MQKYNSNRGDGLGSILVLLFSSIPILFLVALLFAGHIRNTQATAIDTYLTSTVNHICSNGTYSSAVQTDLVTKLNKLFPTDKYSIDIFYSMPSSPTTFIDLNVGDRLHYDDVVYIQFELDGTETVLSRIIKLWVRNITTMDTLFTMKTGVVMTNG